MGVGLVPSVGLISSVGRRSKGGGVLRWSEIMTSRNYLDEVVCRVK